MESIVLRFAFVCCEFVQFVFAYSVVDDNKTRQASNLCDVRGHSDLEEARPGRHPILVMCGATDTRHLKVLVWSEEEEDGLDIIGGAQRRALRVSGTLFFLVRIVLSRWLDRSIVLSLDYVQ